MSISPVIAPPLTSTALKPDLATILRFASAVLKPACGGRCARLRRMRHPRRRHRALDEAAAEHPRLAIGRIVEHAGLAGRDSFLTGDEIDRDALAIPAQPCRPWRPGGANLDESLVPAVTQRLVDRAVAEPIDVAQLHAARTERFARSDHDAARGSVEPHHVERMAGRDAEPAPLADGEMDDAGVPAEPAAVEIDDVAGLGRAWLEPLDHLGVAAGRHEADVLTVMLVGDRKPELACELAGLRLGLVAEGKAQRSELLARGGEQKIALIAFRL